MSNTADGSRISKNKSLNRLSLTVGATSRRSHTKERVDFNAKDFRMCKTVGNCFVEKDDVLEDMLDDEALDRTRSMRAGLTARHHQSSSSDHSSSHSSTHEISKQLLNERRALEAHQAEQAMKKAIQKQIQNAIIKKDSTFSALANDIEESMAFLDSIDKNMMLMEETKRNKTRRQFEDWNTQVHGSIQVS